jgi:predicted Zn-ribbon and HTH transcriptional regulator
MKHCRHCNWEFKPRVPKPKRCPNVKCQRQWPLGQPKKVKVNG